MTPGKLPEPPKGGREAKGGFTFWNPLKPGDTIQGTLAGVVKIKNQRDEERDRHTILVGEGDKSKLWVLPDHVDFMRRMDDVDKANSGVLGVRVWIQFLGKKKIEGVDNPMAQYRIVDYGGGPK